MSDEVRCLMSFRARLILLLASFLLMAMALVILLDNWARRRAHHEVAKQSQEVKEAVNDGFGDFADAISIAIQNLSSDKFLYKKIEDGEIKLPPTVEHIIVADRDGKVADTTVPDMLGNLISVPENIVTQ